MRQRGEVTFTDTVIGQHYQYDKYRMTRSHYTMESRQRFLLFSDGFYSVTPVPMGGFSAVWTSKTMPSTLPTGEGFAIDPFVYAYISGDYVYWKTGNTIRRIHLAIGSTEEIVVTEKNLIRMNVISGVVYYSKYLSSTHIATYRIEAGGLPELIEDSEIKIEQVVEVGGTRN